MLLDSFVADSLCHSSGPSFLLLSYLKDATAATSGAKTEPNIIAGYPTGIAPSKSPNAW